MNKGHYNLIKNLIRMRSLWCLRQCCWVSVIISSMIIQFLTFLFIIFMIMIYYLFVIFYLFIYLFVLLIYLFIIIFSFRQVKSPALFLFICSYCLFCKSPSSVFFLFFFLFSCSLFCCPIPSIPCFIRVSLLLFDYRLYILLYLFTYIP